MKQTKSLPSVLLLDLSLELLVKTWMCRKVFKGEILPLYPASLPKKPLRGTLESKVSRLLRKLWGWLRGSILRRKSWEFGFATEDKGKKEWRPVYTRMPSVLLSRSTMNAGEAFPCTHVDFSFAFCKCCKYCVVKKEKNQYTTHCSYVLPAAVAWEGFCCH